MMRLEHIVPTEMKRAEIITRHKGDKKRNDDPNNYRVITFLSVTLELNEIVLLSHCEIHVFLKSLNMQQSRFQSNWGAICRQVYCEKPCTMHVMSRQRCLSAVSTERKRSITCGIMVGFINC